MNASKLEIITQRTKPQLGVHAMTTLKWDSACRGVNMTPRGMQQMLFVPVPVAYIADLPEAGPIFNIAPHPTKFSDITTLIPKEKMNDPDFVAAPRLPEDMHKVSISSMKM